MNTVNRKKLIAEIVANFHSWRHKMKSKSEPAKGELTMAQWGVMCLLEHSSVTNATALSDLLGISASAITQLIDGLVKLKYVQRTHSKMDRRGTDLRLTPAGWKQLQKSKAEKLKRLTPLFAVLSDSELGQFHALQHKLINQIIS